MTWSPVGLIFSIRLDAELLPTSMVYVPKWKTHTQILYFNYALISTVSGQPPTSHAVGILPNNSKLLYVPSWLLWVALFWPLFMTALPLCPAQSSGLASLFHLSPLVPSPGFISPSSVFPPQSLAVGILYTNKNLLGDRFQEATCRPVPLIQQFLGELN